MQHKQYYVYILTNISSRVLYIGVTRDLIKRIYEHKNNSVSSFTSKYKVSKLVYYEVFSYIEEAIMREKQLKGGSRKKKLELIRKLNPEFNDLYNQII